MAEILIQNISKSFGKNKVLDDLSFEVKDKHFLTLLGPSGCGKTTLLRIIAGLEYSDTGSVIVGGKDITNVPVEKRNIGVVFQNYALIPNMTVFNNIAYGLKIRKVDRQTIQEKVEYYAALVGLGDLQGRKIGQLSGGQQQRVALARALIIEPPILLLDEPLSALDRKIRGEMQYEIRRIQQEVGITTVFVTHDQEEAMTMSDEIVLMHKGRIEQLDTPEQIYNHPISLYSSDFLGKANTLDATLDYENGKAYAVGDGWCFPVVPPAGIEEDLEDICLAIRGEQIEFEQITEEEALAARAAMDGAEEPVPTAVAQIETVVFTGEVCRISAKMGADDITIACINTRAESLRPGMYLKLIVPKDRIHCFRLGDSEKARS
ncbi:MAG: ABC transporter ATP-binding protein [Lachnospiraceae bacterium]|nr:ABC transporter ATP-binding protein [Lachnospiraceae bacterium]